MTTITIDPEFRDLIPPLSAEEYAGLEENIKRDGCLDPLRVWNGILLDGHNRHDICTRMGIPFQTTEIALADRSEAEDWIDRNSLGRRNLTPDQVRLIRGRRYNREKKAIGFPDAGPGRGKTRGQNDPMFIEPERTAERHAKEAGVSPSTIKRDAQAVAILEAHPEKAKAVIKGELKIADAVREIKRAEVVTKLEDVKTREVKQAQGVYDVIVIDPPWQMEKIERDERPNQVAFDYPTMGENQLAEMTIPCADDCHVWLWATHKHLPMAFRLLESWGLKYVCCFTWHKPGGFQPIGCRIRRSVEYWKPGRRSEFTIRYSRPSGNKCEFEKVMEGWGDYLFYGFGGECGKLLGWSIVDLAVFRHYVSWMKSRCNCDVGVLMPNHDGSSFFRVYRWTDVPRQFPSTKPLIVAQHLPAIAQPLEATA